MQTTARGERGKKTPQAARLDAALERVLEALRKAPSDRPWLRREVISPERLEAAAREVHDAATDALPLLDITVEDPVHAKALTKYWNRLKNFRKLTQRLAQVSNWEKFKAIDADEATKAKSMYQKYLEYAREIVNVVSYVEEEHVGTINVDDWNVVLMENERAVWDDDKVRKTIAIIERANRVVREGGFGRALGGRIFAYPREFLRGNALAAYRPQRDVVELASDGEFRETVSTLVHELGHRVYFRLLGANGRKTWRDFYEQQLGAPGISVDEIIRTWQAFVARTPDPNAGWEERDEARNAQYLAYFARYLKKTDPDMFMWLEILARQLQINESFDSITGQPKRNTVPGLDQLIAKKNDAKVFMHPVTAYSATSADELFAETFAHYLLAGPQRIPELVRQAFREATGRFLRVGAQEQQPLRLQRDYGEPGPSAGRVASRHLAVERATERQVEYALALLKKLGSGWHDTDMGQGFGPPSRRDLERMSKREISEFIDELKAEFR